MVSKLLSLTVKINPKIENMIRFCNTLYASNAYITEYTPFNRASERSDVICCCRVVNKETLLQRPCQHICDSCANIKAVAIVLAPTMMYATGSLSAEKEEFFIIYNEKCINSTGNR